MPIRTTFLAAAVWAIGNSLACAGPVPHGEGIRPASFTPIIAPSQTGASLVLYSGSRSDLRWYGHGSLVRSLALCVASPTGRYRVTISSTMGGAASGGERIPYSLSFTDGSGFQQVGKIERSAQVAFDGTAPASAQCVDGPNATLTITMDEQSLASGVAGNYADGLQLTVETR